MKKLIVVVFTIIGIAVGGYIAQQCTSDRQKAVGFANKMAQTYDSRKFAMASAIGSQDIKDIGYTGNIIGGIAGLLLGIGVSKLSDKE